jgi:hypothetical protein
MRLGFLREIFPSGTPDYVVLKNGVRLYPLSDAVTANVTTTTAPAGSIGFTSHATGRGITFYSDGSKWQSQVTGVTTKASGAEVDTGTDDAKFVTAKALADSDYIKEADLPASGGGSYEVATESPATGSNDTFTFSGPPVLVFRNGLMENRLGSVVGNTFVFDSAPNADDDVEGLV